MGPCRDCKKWDCACPPKHYRPSVGNLVWLKNADRKIHHQIKVVALHLTGITGYFVYREPSQYSSTVFVPYDEIEVPSAPKAVPGRRYDVAGGRLGVISAIGAEDGSVYIWYHSRYEAFDPQTMTEKK